MVTRRGVPERCDLPLVGVAHENGPMAYIRHARSQPGELPRMVWIEGTGEGDQVRMTVANAVGVLAKGCGHADELENMAATSGSCVCSGDIWIERTAESHLWNLSVVSATHLGE